MGVTNGAASPPIGLSRPDGVCQSAIPLPQPYQPTLTLASISPAPVNPHPLNPHHPFIRLPIYSYTPAWPGAASTQPKHHHHRSRSQIQTYGNSIQLVH